MQGYHRRCRESNLPIIVTSIDHHQLAAISITGSFLDFLGALYLAFEILGGRNGPLRTLTRGVTMGILFGIGFGLRFGLAFGLAVGITQGISLGFEIGRAGSPKGRYALAAEASFSVLRGLGFALGAATIYGWEFGALFGLFGTVGQIFMYTRGVYPGMSLQPRPYPRITLRQLLGVLIRTLGYGVAGYLSAAIAHHQMHALMFGSDVGIATGLITAVVIFLAPWIEWRYENLSDRRLGVFGIVLILAGFSLQSVQYWIELLDVTVR